MKDNINSENINYLKITYKDRDGFAHCIKSAVRYLTDIEILTSTKFDEDFSIETPQTVEIGIACDNGLYKANTLLKKIEKENPYILFSLQKPTELEYQQKREFFRVKLQENANIFFEENGQEKEIAAVTYDISANGVRIELDKFYDFPEDVRIQLFLPQKNIEIHAKYIRSDEEDSVIKASFMFQEMLSSDLDYISQICFRKQLEERRKNLM